MMFGLAAAVQHVPPDWPREIRTRWSIDVFLGFCSRSAGRRANDCR
jgi:hypothetical protein